MVGAQLRGRDVVDERVLAAMDRVPRELFVPEKQRDHAYDDAALPIGEGQTISQPSMAAHVAHFLLYFVMIALPGHTRGHACVAVDAGHRWLLH